LTRRRLCGCARLVPIGKKQSRSKIKEGTVTCDVIVAGLGARGSTTAHQLYKFASVIGEMLADLVIDGSTRHPIEPFSPDRLAAPE
jgi:hypothetical protein